MSYFAGAEKKDDKVLVPDLGSLTSIYDRCVFNNSLFFSVTFFRVLSLVVKVPLQLLMGIGFSGPENCSII